MKKSESIFKLGQTAVQLNDDEAEILLMVAERLLKGQEQYGKLDVASDPRDMAHEALEEAADGMVYTAIALKKAGRVKRQVGRPKPKLWTGRMYYGTTLNVEYRRANGSWTNWDHHPADGLADAFKGLEALKSICVDQGPVHLIGKRSRSRVTGELRPPIVGVFKQKRYNDGNDVWCARYGIEEGNHASGGYDYADELNIVEPDPDIAPEGKCWTYGSGYSGWLNKKSAEAHRGTTDLPFRLENISQVKTLVRD
jgi:hypothetical protein